MASMTFDAHSFLVDQLRQTTPEKGEQLVSDIGRLGIRFDLDTTSLNVEFWADLDEKKINVPVKCLTRLRARSYAYYSVLLGFLETAGEVHHADLNKRLSRADQLLTWVSRTDVACEIGDGSQYSLGLVPPDLETMLEEALPPEKRSIAEVVFRMAVIFVLHHELAHLRLGHSAIPGPDSIREEYEADRSSVNWLLDIQDQPPAERLARLFGVVVALGWLSSFDIYLGMGDGQTHPPSVERLRSAVRNVVKRATDEAEFAWGICQTILVVHIFNKGLPVDPGDLSGSFEDNVDSLAAIILKAES